MTNKEMLSAYSTMNKYKFWTVRDYTEKEYDTYLDQYRNYLLDLLSPKAQADPMANPLSWLHVSLRVSIRTFVSSMPDRVNRASAERQAPNTS